MPNPVEGLLEVYEDMVEVLLVSKKTMTASLRFCGRVPFSKQFIERCFSHVLIEFCWDAINAR